MVYGERRFEHLQSIVERMVRSSIGIFLQLAATNERETRSNDWQKRHVSVLTLSDRKLRCVVTLPFWASRNDTEYELAIITIN